MSDSELRNILSNYEELERLMLKDRYKRFCMSDGDDDDDDDDEGQRIHQIKTDIHDCRQTETMSVGEYYRKLSQLWDKLDEYEPIIPCECRKCDCDIRKKYEARRDSERLHQFLLGLLPQPYGSLRSVLLSQKPLSTLHRVFHIISQEELARTESPRPFIRRMAAAEEEFANLEEKEVFVCEKYREPLHRNWQMRNPKIWQEERQQKNDKPVYCFAISHRGPWSMKDPVQRVITNIYILVPEHCSLYHFAHFIASSEGTACVGANSKIYVFGGDCGTRVWYMDVVGTGDEQGRTWWVQAKECFNREKRQPLSFSLGDKIYALETQASHTMFPKRDKEVYDYEYCFEVLDTSSDESCWLPLCSPPYPFGACEIRGSWSSDGSSDQGDGYRIFIEGNNNYLFVYDVDTNTWDKFEQGCKLDLVHYPSADYRPYYTWALHSIGKDFAPFPPHVPYTGDLRVLTGLKRSIPQLHQMTSECEEGLPLPFPVRAETDRIEKVSVPCKNSSRCLTGWDLESLWTLHCLPVERLIFWQAIHLGGSSFCTIAYYFHTSCCNQHEYLYARVANFDITDNAAAGGAGEPVFFAEYGANKVYLVSETIFVSPPLPCSKLQPV